MKTTLTSAIFSLSFIFGIAYSQDQPWISEAGRYQISYISELDPIKINRMHSWIMHIETVNGKPLEGASITLEGGMPEHDHGLPTTPRMTEELGAGDYRIEGIRFHMNGIWEITTTITIGNNRDVCIIPIEL